MKILATGQKQSREFQSGRKLAPKQMVAGVKKLTKDWRYDAVSIGYPGVVIRNRPVADPYNLGHGWAGFNFEAAFKCPVKVINDAAMQALGSYKHGKMLFLGLGTGLGSAMVVDGIVEPMELGHLPYRRHTFEDYVGVAGRSLYPLLVRLDLMWRWVTANAPQLSVIVTFLYTLLTGAVVLLMWRSNRQMRRSIAQSAAADEARSRPYLVVEFIRQRGGFVSFRISNFGHSSAKQIRVISNPEIKPVRGTGSVTTIGSIPEFIGLFRQTIPYLAPRQQLQTLIGHYSGVRATYPDLHFTISLQYNGIGGPYSEAVELSLRPTDEALHLTEYEIGQELHEIRETLERIRSKLET